MNDKEYINGFYDHNDSVISNFYISRREKFCSFFMKKYKKRDDYAQDLFTDSILALAKNIDNGKLTSESLHCSLDTYLYAIGLRILWGTDRKSHILTTISLDGAGSSNDDEEVHIPKEITDTIMEIGIDEIIDAKDSELKDFVERMVHEMKSPCSELLDLFYWGRKKWKEIAERLSFATADSAKTQKYKCIQKLKPLVENFMKTL